VVARAIRAVARVAQAAATGIDLARADPDGAVRGDRDRADGLGEVVRPGLDEIDAAVDALPQPGRRDRDVDRASVRRIGRHVGHPPADVGRADEAPVGVDQAVHFGRDRGGLLSRQLEIASGNDVARDLTRVEIRIAELGVVLRDLAVGPEVRVVGLAGCELLRIICVEGDRGGGFGRRTGADGHRGRAQGHDHGEQQRGDPQRLPWAGA
jgi:hypothetical protein